MVDRFARCIDDQVHVVALGNEQWCETEILAISIRLAQRRLR